MHESEGSHTSTDIGHGRGRCRRGHDLAGREPGDHAST